MFLDFLNREAERATGRTRPEALDIEIIRTLITFLPYGFSVNVSQLSEYCSERPQFFSAMLRLLNSRVVDATSQSVTIGDFISSRQVRYRHAAERYPFYFDDSKRLETLKLGSRNDFDMTAALAAKLLSLDPQRLDFELTRAIPSDRASFAQGLHALRGRIFSKEDRAITRDLLITKDLKFEMSPDQIDSSTRVISAIYMDIYAENKGLIVCTGIPEFIYREDLTGFPLYDFPILAELQRALLGRSVNLPPPIEELAEIYGAPEHHRFHQVAAAFLVAIHSSALIKVNNREALSSIRAIFTQYIHSQIKSVGNASGTLRFFSDAVRSISSAGNEISIIDPIFAETWRKFMPQPTEVRKVLLTTATPREDTALITELQSQGFSEETVRVIGGHLVQEYGRGGTNVLFHVRTSAGSIGLNSAGPVLQQVVGELKPQYVISAGICFGLKPSSAEKMRQSLADVVVSSSIVDYETTRVGKKEVVNRGDRVPAGQLLLQSTRFAARHLEKSGIICHEGLVVCGQKLVDNEKLVLSLRSTFPDAEAGEMEGNALVSAATSNQAQWVLIKGICDWGYDKDDSAQVAAGTNACKVAVRSICILFDALSN